MKYFGVLMLGMLTGFFIGTKAIEKNFATRADMGKVVDQIGASINALQHCNEEKAEYAKKIKERESQLEPITFTLESYRRDLSDCEATVKSVSDRLEYCLERRD